VTPSTRHALGVAGLLVIAGGFAGVAQYFARRGNWAGGAAASALGLLVGIYAVMRLWRPAASPFGVRQLTRAGFLYALAILVVGSGALSSANNLLFLILACMLAALLASGLFSRLNLAELELQCSAPEDIFAGQNTPARFSLRNLKGWMPSFSVWLRVDLYIEGGFPEVYFPMLAGGEARAATLNLRFARRGRYEQDTFWLRSAFPFGLLWKSARLRLRREIIVYPSVETTPELEALLPLLNREWEARRAGLGQELYRVRPYQPGDSSRVVHWKASAHTGELKVREFSAEEDRRVELVFDRCLPSGRPGDWSGRFNAAVDLCAALAWQLHSRGGLVCFQPGNLEDIYDILRYLALVEPAEDGPPLELQPGGMFQVIFTASPGRFAASLPESSYYCYDLESL